MRMGIPGDETGNPFRILVEVEGAGPGRFIAKGIIARIAGIAKESIKCLEIHRLTQKCTVPLLAIIEE